MQQTSSLSYITMTTTSTNTLPVSSLQSPAFYCHTRKWAPPTSDQVDLRNNNIAEVLAGHF